MIWRVLFIAHLTPLIGDLSNKRPDKTKACAEKCSVIPLSPRGYEVAKSRPAKQAKSLKLRLTGHIARRQCEKAEFYIWDTELPGFGLRFRPSGGKRWFLRYKERGRARVWTIGNVTDICVEGAREAARKRLREVALLVQEEKGVRVSYWQAGGVDSIVSRLQAKYLTDRRVEVNK